MHKPSHATVVAYVALTLSLGGTAVAATGGAFVLGESNRAGERTVLTNTGDGPALVLDASAASTPALSVRGNDTKVADLNADLVDGLSADALQRRIGEACPALAGIRSVAPSGGVTCAASAYRIIAESGSFLVPAGTTTALIEVRGAGGGGGQGLNNGNGSGGAQGGLARVLVSVVAGQSFSVTIGAGGAGGTASTSGLGVQGAPTYVRRTGATADIARATGGTGGFHGQLCEVVEADGATGGGFGGSGLQPTAAASLGLSRQGGDGGGPSSYTGPSCPSEAIGGRGGAEGFAGAGGKGGLGTTSSDGVPGEPGFVLVQFLH